jgi:hypothetical protein
MWKTKNEDEGGKEFTCIVKRQQVKKGSTP